MASASDTGRMTSRLHRHRYRIVLWIAVIEGVLIFITHGVNAWTIVVLGTIALVSLFVYRLARDRTHSELLHEITWLIAASQLGATLAVSAGYIVKGALVVLIVLFALVALGLLLLDRG